MDDNTQILQQILNVLEKAVGNSASSGSSGPSAAQSSFDESLLTASQRAAKLSVEFEEQAKQIKSATKDVFGKFFTSVKESISPFGKYTDEIEKATKEYNTHIRTVSNVNRAEDKREKERLKSDLNRLKSEAVLNIATVGLKTNLQNLSQGALATFGTLKNMQDGAQGGEFQTAGELFKTSIGLMVDAVGTGASVIGAAFSGIPIIGGAAAALGQAVAAAGEATKKLVNAVTDIATKEITKTIDGFRDLSASGVMFADGMTGMRNAAEASGLTIKQFSNVVKKSSDELSASGLGVAKASTMIGGALTTGGGALKNQLLNLGYDFEEQGGLVAETLRDMAGVGGPLKASNAQVAQQTAKYAENLRIISGITGEDAKKKMQEARDAANNLAFNQKLAGMDVSQRQNVMAAMLNMSDLQKKSFMEMVTFGSVINKEGAMMMGSSQAFASGIQEFTTKFQGGALDAQSALDIQSKYGDQLRQDLLSNTDVAAAGLARVGGAAGNLATEMNKTLNFVQKYTKEAIEQATKGAQEQGKTKDPLTERVNATVSDIQKMQIEIEKLLSTENGLAAFASATSMVVGTLRSGLEKINELINKIPVTTTESDAANAAKLKKEQENWDASSWWNKLWNARPGSNPTELDSENPGGARTGGIISGPTDGFKPNLEMHGTELILPLTSDRKIKDNTYGLELLQSIVGKQFNKPVSKPKESIKLSLPTFNKEDTAEPSGISSEASKLTTGFASMMSTAFNFEKPSYEYMQTPDGISSEASKLTTGFASMMSTAFNFEKPSYEYMQTPDETSPTETQSVVVSNMDQLMIGFEKLEQAIRMQSASSEKTNALLDEHSDYLRNLLRVSQ